MYICRYVCNMRDALDKVRRGKVYFVYLNVECGMYKKRQQNNNINPKKAMIIKEI